MTRAFLEQESINANKRKRKFYLFILLFSVCIGTFLYFATRTSIDLNDPTDYKLAAAFFIWAGFMLFVTILGIFRSFFPAKNGKNLTLPFEEKSRQAVSAVINQEAADGKTQVEGFMNNNTIKKYYDRVLLLPSYLLLIENMGRITAIPRDKIYWTCAQVGHKGGPFYVRLLIFTEKKIFEFDGNDIEHTKEIANELYQYIPNTFRRYDPQELSYALQKLFRENPAGFLEFYEDERKNFCS